MKITFLIGNGFDLNLGLKTSFIDFLNWYKTKKDAENSIIVDMYKADDEKNWSNMELKLGKITTDYFSFDKNKNNLSYDDPERFIKDKSLLEENLMLYLSEEQDKFNILSKEKAINVLFGSFNTIYSEMTIEEKETLTNIINQTNDNIICQFISFNYTNTLDSIIEISYDREMNVFGSKNHRRVCFRQPFHIHGTIHHQPILGVNDIKQISNNKYTTDDLFCRYMIKKNMSDIQGNKLYERATQMIDESRIVIVYGMSFGATDKIWWEHLAKWQGSDETKKFIILKYDDDFKKKATHTIYDEIERKTNYIKEPIFNIMLDSDIMNTYIKNTICIINSNIFNFKSVNAIEIK